MDAATKIVKSRVELQTETPFFSYLCLHLNPTPTETIPSAGIDIYGNLYYNKKWIESLSIREIKAVLIHEVMHLVFEHLERILKRDPSRWNIAADLCVNNVIITNGFTLPKTTLIPTNNTFKIFNKTIVDIDKKLAEEIYNEIPKPKTISISGFDIHYYEVGDDKDGKGDSKDGDNKDKSKKGSSLGKSAGKVKRNWKRVLVEAATIAKMQGNVPAGMDRYVDKILYPKLSWKELLYKYITRELPCDYTWTRPSRRSIATGYYMPSVVKESIDVLVSVDTSGSIGPEELTEFISEIVNLSQSFIGLRMTVIVHDCIVYETYELSNATTDDILNIKLKGGGGTDHSPVYAWIKDNKPQAKILIAFTDGFTDFPKAESIKTIWVLSKNHVDIKQIPFGDIVELN